MFPLEKFVSKPVCGIALQIRLTMDKLQLAGQTWAEFSTLEVTACVCAGHLFCYEPKTAQLKVENSAQTTFRFSPNSFCTPWSDILDLATLLKIHGLS
jgi:hypothetical protein